MQNGNGYQGFGDMVDGGGAGQSGQSFEGGGLLSMIANMIAKPRGSQQRQQEQMGGLLSPQARPDTPMQMPQGYEIPPPGSRPRPQFPNTPPPSSMQPMTSQGAGVPNVNGASLSELEALYQQMVAAGILPPQAPQMQRGPF
jgi:hypothetical protein